MAGASFEGFGVGVHPSPTKNPWKVEKVENAVVRVEQGHPTVSKDRTKTPRTELRERVELEEQLENAQRQLRPTWSLSPHSQEINWSAERRNVGETFYDQEDIELQGFRLPNGQSSHHSENNLIDEDLEGGLVVSTRDGPISQRSRDGSRSKRVMSGSSRRGDMGVSSPDNTFRPRAEYGTFESGGPNDPLVIAKKYQHAQVVSLAQYKVDQNIAELESLKQRMQDGEDLTVDDLMKLSPRSAYHLQQEGMVQPATARTMNIRRQYAEGDMASNRTKVIGRLDRRIENDFDGICDRLANEFFITGQVWFDYFSPKELGGHAVIFTWVFFTVCCMVFCFMAGQYPYWFIKTNHSDVNSILDMYTTDPRGMFYFLWSGTDADVKYTFAFNYLLLWGGRWLPSIDEGQWWRWLTSMILHENHNHITSNMALFLVLSYFMEQKYGTCRVMLIAIISGFGGNLFSAMFESDCMLVMGASGLIFGLFGLYITDLLVNFESIQRPVMQGICVMTLLIYFAWCAANSGRHSSDISHLGGLICGLFPSFLVIPTFKASQDWEAVLPFVALIVIGVVFIVFPCYIYYHILPINCMA